MQEQQLLAVLSSVCHRLGARSPPQLQQGALAGWTEMFLISRSNSVDCLCVSVRPPGHHAQFDTANGYSIFNHVAVAARYARSRHSVSRSVGGNQSEATVEETDLG